MHDRIWTRTVSGRLRLSMRVVSTMTALAGCALLLFALGCESDSGERAGDYYEAHAFSIESPPQQPGGTAAPDPAPGPTPTPPPQPAPLSVSVTPESMQLDADGEIAILEASGGRGGYTWGVQYPSRGNLNRATGGSVIYTRNESGNNVVTVTDGNETVNLLLRQP